MNFKKYFFFERFSSCPCALVASYVSPLTFRVFGGIVILISWKQKTMTGICFRFKISREWRSPAASLLNTLIGKYHPGVAIGKSVGPCPPRMIARRQPLLVPSGRMNQAVNFAPKKVEPRKVKSFVFLKRWKAFLFYYKYVLRLTMQKIKIFYYRR